MKKAENELEIILNDKVHGSSELLNLICIHFLKYKNNAEHLNKALHKIKQNLSHFPVITNFLKDIENILNGKKQDSLTDYLIKFRKENDETYERMFKRALNILSTYKIVLTISHSKTLIKIFKLWKKSCSDLKVIICESRPNYEGILMADEISKLRIKTEVIPESMSGNIIKEVDAVILGADQILSNGNIVNKTGSRMLAVLAKYHKIPVYVLASSDKIVRKKIISHEKLNQYKLAPIKNKNIKFRNKNFEEIEKELISKIFTA